MAQIVEVNGEPVEFPDNMSDEQIAAAITANMQPSQSQGITSGYMMGLKDPITAGAQMLPRGLATIASLGGLVPNVASEWLSKEAQRVDEMARAEEAQYQANRAAIGESGFDAARLAGNIINPANIAAGLGGARVASAMGRGVGAQATLGGAAGGALAPVYGEDFAAEKTAQTLLGGIGGKVGQEVVERAGRVLSPLLSAAEQRMKDLGIKLTPGQALGGRFKSLEEFAQNLPIIGKDIEEARAKTLFNFNKSIINKALGKVDTQLPEDVIGHDAMDFATTVVSQKYDDLLSKMSFQLDMPTYGKILSGYKSKGLSEDQLAKVTASINDLVYSRLPKGQPVTGTQIKVIESDLRDEALGYLNSQSMAEKKVGMVLMDSLNTFKESLYKQNRELYPQLKKIDDAFADISVMRTAAANSAAESGVFTPKQLSTAVRQSDLTRGKRKFAVGKARLQKEADAALEVIGNDPRATLEGRVAAQAAGGLAAITDLPTTIGAAAAVKGGIYSPAGIAAINAAMMRRPEWMQKAGQAVQRAAPVAGALMGGPVASQYRMGTRTEEEIPQVEVIGNPGLFSRGY
jgi:DNA-binding ferritin-like protein (Dps family)